MLHRQTCVLLIISLCALADVCVGGDWPQILGPNRDGIAVGETLLKEWPDSGPEEVWKADVGQGFAGVAVYEDVVYGFHRVDDAEIVEARAAATGDVIWTRKFPCDYQGGYSNDSGPRCVPVVTNTRLFVFGVEGVLRCLDRAEGSEVWSRQTANDYKTPEGYFGVGSTPVLHDGKLLVNVGGRKNAAVVAFSASDGETVWQSFSDTASYSSPVIADIAGMTHAVFVTRYHVVSLDPSSGKIRFQFPFGMRGPTVNGATPVVVGNHLFVSSSYRVGSVWAKIGSGEPVLNNSGETLLATQYATPIQHDGLLYAVDGRQDTGDASIKCIDPSLQKILWEEPGFQYGSLIRVNADLLFLTCGGDLLRIAADRSEFRQLHKSKVLSPTLRGYRLPAVSNGRLFIRDDRVLKCLHVGEIR
jgi:outer membrane protein assembly factor BamB